jgi:hypothetical protein
MDGSATGGGAAGGVSNGGAEKDGVAGWSGSSVGQVAVDRAWAERGGVRGGAGREGQHRSIEAIAYPQRLACSEELQLLTILDRHDPLDCTHNHSAATTAEQFGAPHLGLEGETQGVRLMADGIRLGGSRACSGPGWARKASGLQAGR